MRTRARGCKTGASWAGHVVSPTSCGLGSKGGARVAILGEAGVRVRPVPLWAWVRVQADFSGVRRG